MVAQLADTWQKTLHISCWHKTQIHQQSNPQQGCWACALQGKVSSWNTPACPNCLWQAQN